MRAKRSLGQNFLRDESVIRTIVDALDLSPEDLVIEIGPGRGALTEHLVKSQAFVTAVELDSELAPYLDTVFRRSSKFRVIEADFLEVGLDTLIDDRESDNVCLVGNLPYYISTAILQKLAGERQHFSAAVLMLQREVVDRITASPGESERGFLTVLIESAFDVRRLLEVSPVAFVPRPKVSSSVIKLAPKPFSTADQPGFRELVSSAFTHKRKTIVNNLKAKYPDIAETLFSINVDPKRRAESLAQDEWVALYSALQK